MASVVKLSFVLKYCWRKFHSFLQKILRTVRGLLGFTILLLSVILIYLPNCVLRGIAVGTARLRSGYGRVMTALDVLNYEDLSNNKAGAHRCPLLATATLKGDICLEELRKIFKDTVLNAKVIVRSQEKLRYPELQQRHVHWLGFQFMRSYDGFKVEEHIVENSETSIKSLREVHQCMMNKRFSPDKSPWELVVFRDVSPGHIVLAFRIHHSLADALSILKLFVECFGEKGLKTAKPKEKKRPWREEILYRLTLPVSIGNDYVNLWWDVVRHSIRCLGVWKRRGRKKNTPRKVVLGLSETIAMADVKTVAKTFNATSSAVIMCGVIRALEKFLKTEFGTRGESELPVGYVLPMDDHPKVLANHWSTTYAVLKCGDHKSTAESLRSFNDAFLEMKYGTRRTFMKYSVLFGGSCLVKLAKIILKNKVCSVGMTNIAGEDEGFCIGGRECAEYSLSSGGVDGIEILFCIMSYKGRFRVSCISDESIMSEKSIESLSEFVWREFQQLRQDSILAKKNDSKLEVIIESLGV